MIVLAVETSCDDTSVAIVGDGGFVRAVVSANQDLAHADFGGIVPEIASRNHTYNLLPLVDACLKKASMTLDEIDAFAVTSKPGLVGSLLVGLVAVKSLSLATGKPFVGVNHLEGHLLAGFLKDSEFSAPEGFGYPFVALAVSGGHTSLYQVEGLGQYQVLGQTIDDAAGEAFDKFGKMVGLGFPGGVRVDHYSKAGHAKRFQFPRSLMNEEHLNFSFSGLKAAGARTLNEFSAEDREQLARELEIANRDPKAPAHSGLLADLCASFQEAITDVLIDRISRAAKKFGAKRVVLTGGVSANSRLRARATEWAHAEGLMLVVPPVRYCTDNAAMIGYVGLKRLELGESSDQTLGPEPRAPLGVAPLPKNLPEWLVKAKS